MFFLPTRKLFFPRAGLLYHSKSFLFPHHDRLILTSTGQGLSICTEGDTVNRRCMAVEGTHCLAGGQVPHLDRLILTSTGQGLSICTEGDTVNGAFMSCEGTDTMPREIFWRYQRFRFSRLFL